MSSKLSSNTYKNYLLLNAALFFYSISGLCGKAAASYPIFSFPFVGFSGLVFVVLALYALMWQQILKHFPLMTAYANKSIVLLWGMLWGKLAFHEQITWNMMLGAGIILIGIYLVHTDET